MDTQRLRLALAPIELKVLDHFGVGKWVTSMRDRSSQRDGSETPTYRRPPIASACGPAALPEQLKKDLPGVEIWRQSLTGSTQLNFATVVAESRGTAAEGKKDNSWTPTDDAVSRFTDRILTEWLPAYCSDPQRGYSAEGFDRGSITVSERDAADFLLALECGVVKIFRAADLRAHRSKVSEVIFWEGHKKSVPRKITLWLNLLLRSQPSGGCSRTTDGPLKPWACSPRMGI